MCHLQNIFRHFLALPSRKAYKEYPVQYKEHLEVLNVVLKYFLKYLVNGTRTPWRNACLSSLGQEMNKMRLEHLVILKGELLSQRLLASVRRMLEPTSLDSQQLKLGCMHTTKIKLQ